MLWSTPQKKIDPNVIILIYQVKCVQTYAILGRKVGRTQVGNVCVTLRVTLNKSNLLAIKFCNERLMQ